MRRIISALFLTIYLLNLSSHEIIHRYLEYKSDKLYSEQALRGHYNVSDLTEVKIPVNMPGIRDWEDYENISGKIQFGKTSYNYVKLKVTKKVMYLMCVPNYETTQLTDQNVIHAEGMKEVPIPKKDHVPYGKVTSSLGNFNFALLQFKFIPPYKTSKSIVVHPGQQLLHQSMEIPEQPPKPVC